MFRSTTPTFYFRINTEEKLDTISDIWITFKGIGTYDKNSLTKKISDDCVYLDLENKIITVDLTQEETKSFKGNEVQVQIKFYFSDEKVYASSIYKIPICSPLNDEIMG